MTEEAVEVSPRITELLRDALVWDNHLCMPLRPEDDSFLPQLARCRDLGYTVVSLNIGFDATPWENAVATVAAMRRWVALHERDYRLVHTVADIEACRRDGRLGVCFDIEGGKALNEQLAMVQLYYDLGVRWMLFAYNLNNALAGGCQDDNAGLTDFGRAVLGEMERVGMVVCCSHTSYQASHEILERATRPVIFSHSNPRALTDHYRNIPDELMRACAATGGVVGINGIGDFLGAQQGLAEAFAAHVDYAVQTVGVDHVALGTDYVFDRQELIDYVNNHPEVFDPKKYSGDFAMLEPEQLPAVVEQLQRRHYSEEDLRKVLGGNLLRVAKEVWR